MWRVQFTLKPSRFALATALVSTMAFCSGGCETTTQTKQRWTKVGAASWAASQQYLEARGNAEVVQMVGLNKDDYIDKWNEGVLTPLRAALSNSADPKIGAVGAGGACPILFLSKWADLVLELEPYYGEEVLGEAWTAYEQACLIEADWVPGWLGLAEIARRRGQKAELNDALHGAEVALGNLRIAAQDPDPPRSLSLMEALGLIPVKTQSKTGNQERLMVLTTYLVESERWDVDQPSILRLSPTEIAEQEMDADLPSIIRRLQSRYEMLLIRSDESMLGTPTKKVIARLRQIDRDYFPAQRELARRLCLLGRFDDAEDVLSPWVSRGIGKTERAPALQLELTQLYADWYEESGNQTTFNIARERYEAMLEVDVLRAYAPTYIGLCRLHHARWQKTRDEGDATRVRWCLRKLRHTNIRCLDPEELRALEAMAGSMPPSRSASDARHELSLHQE